MVALPSFLFPELALNGEWEEIVNRLYEIFKQDFIDKHVYCEKLAIDFDRRKITEGKEEIFWHLISKNIEDAGRLPDYDRARKIHWIRPIILNLHCIELISWNYLEGSGKTRKYIWLKSMKYIVILEYNRKSTKMILITAFCVDNYKERDLEKKYKKKITVS